MSENEKDIESKQKRSPRFPVISIGEAIEKARRIYEKDRRAFATMEAILEHMGFTPKMRAGGRSGRTVAALKQYGLLDERTGKYRISDTAFKILELPEESSERDALIREAAYSPPIFRKILEQFEGIIPSDTTLRSHLIFSEGFNPDSAGDFIKVLRRTTELVPPHPEDYTGGVTTEGGEQPLEGGLFMSSPPPASPQPRGLSGLPPERTVPRRDLVDSPPPGYWPTPAGWTGGQKELRFNIARDSEATVTFSGPVTQEAIGKLIVLLQASQDTFPTKAELEPPQPNPQPQHPEPSPSAQLFSDLDESFPSK